MQYHIRWYSSICLLIFDKYYKQSPWYIHADVFLVFFTCAIVYRPNDYDLRSLRLSVRFQPGVGSTNVLEKTAIQHINTFKMKSYRQERVCQELFFGRIYALKTHLRASLIQTIFYGKKRTGVGRPKCHLPPFWIFGYATAPIEERNQNLLTSMNMIWQWRWTNG